MSFGRIVGSKSFWLGVGAVVVYEYYPEISAKLRPALVNLVRSGYRLAEEAKTAAERGKEAFEDIAAEARMAPEEAEEPAPEAPKTKKTTRRKKPAPQPA